MCFLFNDILTLLQQHVDMHFDHESDAIRELNVYSLETLVRKLQFKEGTDMKAGLRDTGTILFF